MSYTHLTRRDRFPSAQRERTTELGDAGGLTITSPSPGHVKQKQLAKPSSAKTFAALATWLRG